mgnify:CR=1 FL=1
MFLERYSLPPTPLNYQVVYTYTSQNNLELNKDLDRAIAVEDNIDSVLIEQLHAEFLNTGHTEQVNMIQNVDGVISSLSQNSQATEKQIIRFAGQVSECVHSLDENNIEQSRQALEVLHNQTAELLNQHKQFKQELSKAKQLHEKTQKQLTQLRKQHIIDSQTGLYKRHYLTQQTQVWTNQQKSICAIAIQIDNLDHFTENYGDIIGEVILNKVAKQVQKYVFQSDYYGGLRIVNSKIEYVQVVYNPYESYDSTFIKTVSKWSPKCSDKIEKLRIEYPGSIGYTEKIIFDVSTLKSERTGVYECQYFQ